MVVTGERLDASHEQTRALYPGREGYIERDGVKIFFEVYGEGDRTVLFMPTWSIIHSRIWKMQIPYFARHFRVVTFDGRGNGRSDRPATSMAYSEREFVADTLAVMDATKTEKAALVSLSLGSQRALMLAADHPERVAAAAFIGPSLPIAPGHDDRVVVSFDDELDSEEGWAKYNRHYWMKDYRGFLEFFFSKCFTEPHSTKQMEDAVGWGLDTDPETLVATAQGAGFEDAEDVLEACRRVRCPVLVLHGDHDAISPHRRGAELARATEGTLVTLEGAGHIPLARDPVRVNLLLRDFLEPPRPPATWVRGRSRRKRALFVSSPIGLGHAQRDVAIAKELRALAPDLEIDWLAQHPVTNVLEQEGERIHPASRFLANESQHIESESAEHDLHCFQAWRRMDEILLSNFMLFHDVIRDEDYDLWIGDEAWELDYYLHENPDQKRAAYAWLTDFVGWLPMADGGDREAFLTADYNAEMIEHIARYPRIRDRAIFVGTPEDIVPDRFGPDLPLIREWTEEHYAFSNGYITGFDPADFADTEALRAELGYRSDEKVCIVTVGGSGVGAHLLRRVMAAFADAKRRVPELRMIVVAGPRIDPASLPAAEGLEVRAYVHNLYRHLAACDLAIVQGGLTTAMELTSNKRPFLYFPLRHHFEQNFHVRHRLDRYGAGRRMDFDLATPEVIAEAIAQEIGRSVNYEDVEPDGARQAAAAIAELI
ncbi:MAG: alpha/beta fold hydrolase [Actinobacteria bacterium]|nr:alpha/beta fold hydrolase [Actinomycetota bacterium]